MKNKNKAQIMKIMR